MMPAPRRTPFAAMLLAAALGGCVALTGKVPASLIRLAPAATAPAGAIGSLTSGEAVTVLVPATPAEIATLRVPVHGNASTLSYLKDAQFADFPARLFRDLLAETVRVRTGRPVLDIRDYHLAPGPKLFGRIATFGLETQGGDTVVLTYDAVLQHDATHSDTRRFEARVPVAATTTAAVAPALDQAANQVAAQVADWVGAQR